jgi:hypothetical protein
MADNTKETRPRDERVRMTARSHEHRRRAKANRFGAELHTLLALLGVKRSAFGDRGYTYSLHKQICRGERPPSARALAALEKLLNHRLAVVLAAARRDHARLERLEGHLESLTWLRRNNKTGHWTADASALGRLWQGHRPSGSEEGLPILIEGTLVEAIIERPASTPMLRLRLKHSRVMLTATENGEVRLTAILSPAGAERLRRALAGE